MVSHVYEDWLSNFLHEKFMLWVLLYGICNIPEILVADEGMKEYIIKLHEQGQLLFFSLW